MERSEYDRPVSKAGLIAVPLTLFVGVSGTVFALAELHPARPAPPKAPATVTLGDQGRGAALFSERCAACHGADGVGGGIGPRLAGNPITLRNAVVRIESGGGAMPPGLVKGQQERDVLAYLATILAKPAG
jgi:mono/diheme cytochrome c family protein